MSEKYLDFHQQAIEKVRSLWHLYIINKEPEELEEGFKMLPGNMLMIGTGRHELYKNLDEFLNGMTADQTEARNVQFELLDEWYEAQEITEDVCVVYGSIWVREKSTPGKAVLVDMEGSRFTVVCRKTPDGIMVCSLHHSMPYMDQGEDEYYPQTLASLANEAIQKSKMLEHRIQLDHMTGLYNHVYMELHVAQELNHVAGYFFSIDLDNFKSVNDSKGHLAGDKVIKEFGHLLRQTFSASAIVGRMGGDEFAVWDSNIQGSSGAERCLSSLTEGCHRLSESLGVTISCSTGIVCNKVGENFTSLYMRADQAMYCAKVRGKNQFFWDIPPNS